MSTNIEVQPGALMTSASAVTTIDELNTSLASHGLCLPVEPLERGLSLAELVRRNAGGRRQMKYGTIAHYLRAVDVRMESGEVLRLGGPTLKRATGYALQRVLVGGGTAYLPGVASLVHLVMNVRPLPPARHEVSIVCNDMPAACRLSAQIVQAGLNPGALALMNDAGFGVAFDDPHDKVYQPAKRFSFKKHTDTVLLVELEGMPAVLERQTQQLTALAKAADAFIATSERYATTQPYASEWEPWELLAERWPTADLPRLTVTLPQAASPSFAEQANTLAQRYGLDMPLWGDAGAGRLHLGLQAKQDSSERAAGEIEQAAALLLHLARRLGGAVCTDQTEPLPAKRVQFPAPPPAASPPALNGTTLLSRLREALGPEHVLTRDGDLVCYAADASIAKSDGLPLAVVLPGSTAEVSTVLRLASEARVPVVTRGAGSGLAGGATSAAGNLVLVLTRLQDLHIDAAQQVAHMEAGTVTAELQSAADSHGLLYAPDPSSQGVSTIGGNIACNAGGPRCLKYGVTSSYVLALKAVLADGNIIRVGDGISGQTADAGLMHLLVGSEGTLAVVTEATLRLSARPATRRTALAFFERLDDACATVESIMASGVLPAGLELMDDTSIRVVEDAMHLGLPRDVGALLLLLADGEPEAVEQEVQQLAELAQKGGARSVQVAQNASDEAGFWRARRSVSPSFARVKPNKLGEDICVPLTQIAATVRRIKAISTQYDLPIPVFGHAGDGNLHPNILFDARKPDEVQRAWQAAEEIFRVALEHGGTLSGEHGIGTLKRPFLAQALGAEVLALHQALKARFDPQGLLNPGKVI
jgi:glycolate oxidase subunit GlcD